MDIEYNEGTVFFTIDDPLSNPYSHALQYALSDIQLGEYFPVVLFIMLYKTVLTFESVDEILKCDHSNESY